MKRDGITERDDREATDIALSLPSSSPDLQILNLARLLARLAARDAIQAPGRVLERNDTHGIEG